MKSSNRQIFSPFSPQRTVNRNHPIEADWFLCAQSQSFANQQIFRRSQRPIIRNRQVKLPNRQSPTICGAANPFKFDGIGFGFRTSSQVFEKGDPKNYIPEDVIQHISHEEMKNIVSERYDSFHSNRRKHQAIKYDDEDLKAIENLEKDLRRNGAKA